MKKRLGTVAKILIAAIVIVVGATAMRIYTYGDNVVDVKADAAIVLGAAVWGDDVSPVFRERINHAIDLHRRGKVSKIIFTGGQGNRDELTEAATARAYAIENGVPKNDILLEERSHTTYENVRQCQASGRRAWFKASLDCQRSDAYAKSHNDGDRCRARSLPLTDSHHEVSRMAKSDALAGP